MKQFFKVFRFEYANYAKNKVFIGLTAVLLIIVTAVLFFPRFKGEEGASPDDGKALLAVSDQTGLGLGEYFKTALGDDFEVTLLEGGEAELKARVESGDFDGAVLLTAPLEYKYIVNNMGLYDGNAQIFDELLLFKYKSEYLEKAGLPADKIAEFNALVPHGETVVAGQDLSQSFFYTYILMFLLYMAVLMYGQAVAQSVVTEKSSRTMELLITCADPRALIFGKVLGTGLAGLTQLLLVLGWSAVCFNINKSFWADNFVIQSIFGITPALIGYASVFFVLGFLLYAFLYGALASLASKTEEIGPLTMPVTFLMVIAFMVTIFSISFDSSDNILMKILSYLPFSSPMAMFTRLAMNSAGPIQAMVSIAVLIISNLLTGRLAVAIYRVGILMYGKPPRLNELARAIKNSRQ